MRTPSAERLETSALLSKRMLDKHFRTSLPLNEKGERHVVIADPDERLGDVFARIDGVGMPSTICVPVGGGGLFPIIVREPESIEKHDDHQDCSPDTELGMLVELLAGRHAPICVALKHPVQLQLAVSHS